MFVLLLGHNHSSVINSYCIGLEENGVPHAAISFDFVRNAAVNYERIHIVFKNNKYSRLHLLIGVVKLIHLARKADVIHVFSNFSIQSRLGKLVERYIFGRKDKKYFITFTGSDVRIPEIELDINPYFKYAYFNPGYEGRKYETRDNSISLQRKFSDLGFRLISNPEVEHFIQPGIFRQRHLNYHPSANHMKVRKSSQSGKFLIVHAPSNFYTKGTNFVLEAIRILEQKIPGKFEFRLITGVSNMQFQEVLAGADLFVDQLIWGWYGVATQQALEYGTNTVAYLEESKLAMVEDCPIINANINSLATTLENLVTTPPALRNSESNTVYYQKYHSPDSVVKRSIEFYRS